MPVAGPVVRRRAQDPVGGEGLGDGERSPGRPGTPGGDPRRVEDVGLGHPVLAQQVDDAVVRVQQGDVQGISGLFLSLGIPGAARGSKWN
jgi:hypothetical protein